MIAMMALMLLDQYYQTKRNVLWMQSIMLKSSMSKRRFFGIWWLLRSHSALCAALSLCGRDVALLSEQLWRFLTHLSMLHSQLAFLKPGSSCVHNSWSSCQCRIFIIGWDQRQGKRWRGQIVCWARDRPLIRIMVVEDCGRRGRVCDTLSRQDPF